MSAAALLGVLWIPGAHGGVGSPTPASLLKDIDPGTTPHSSIAYGFTAVGGTVYFAGYTNRTGAELWRTDGTAAGTSLVRDIWPGGYPGWGAPEDMVTLGGTLFFTAGDGSFGRELWRSDGTAAGTALLKDINPGGGGSFPASKGPSQLASTPPEYPAIVIANGTMFFFADDVTNGTELWKSDGTAAGTVLVKDIRPGLGSSVNYSLTSQLPLLTAVGASVFFVADDGTNGPELWKSDGTAAGTVLVKDVNPGAAGGNLRLLKAVGALLYFGSNSYLWRSDGTEGGTVQVQDGVGGFPRFAWLRDVGGTPFFRSLGDGELWKIDAGTAVLVKDIRPGAASSASTPLAVSGSTLYLSANDGTNGIELWKSDGTDAGTVLVKDIQAGSGNSSPARATASGGILLFAATTTATGQEIWWSDGTSLGTVLLKDINPGALGSSLAALVAAGGTTWFCANDGVVGRELWKTDGTSPGTSMVAELSPGTAASGGPYFITALRGRVVFDATEPATGSELWTSDGTAAGTALLKDLVAGGDSYPDAFVVSGGKAYFRSYDFLPPYQDHTWETDGTSGGTVLLADIESTPGVFVYSFLGAVGTTLFFSALDLDVVGDTVAGVELWKRVEGVPGLGLVKDINPGVGDSSPGVAYLAPSGVNTPSGFAILGGTAFFAADDGTNGAELWKSDGTESGTVLLKDIRPGAEGSRPSGLAVVGGTLYFAADDGTSGEELWKSDGTALGTERVADLYPGAGGSVPRDLADFDGAVLFTAVQAATGRELWKSDGTAAGTVLVKDIRAGADGSTPRWLETLPGSGKAVFSAEDGTTGMELWITDGTPGGTLLLQDIAPGPDSSNAQEMCFSAGRVLFTADDGVVGYELWSAPYEELGISRSTMDADRDGYADEVEIALGSSPYDAADLPPGRGPAGAAQELLLGKSSVALDFDDAGRDSVSVTGLLPVDAGFQPLGSKVVVDMGGVVREFTLDEKGRSAPPGTASFRIALKFQSGLVIGNPAALFKAKVARSDLAALLQDEGLRGDATVAKVPRDIPVTVYFDGAGYSGVKPLLYTAKAGKAGKAK